MATLRSCDPELTSMSDNLSVDEILIVGLGSVGRRHLANLRALGWTRIRAVRTRGFSSHDIGMSGVAVDHDLSVALSRRPLAVIISNPSALHIISALEAARAGAHLLIEKPLASDLQGVAELESLVADRRLRALVGFQFRYNPGLRQIRAWLGAGAIGSVVTAQVHWGEYLPDAHPWEDYRSGYAARAELGGGVLLTLSHPFDYLRWLLGEIAHEWTIESRCDALGLPVDTCTDVAVRF